MWRDRPAKCRAQSSDRHSRAQDHRRQHTRSFARRPRVAPSAGRISVKRNLARIRKSLAAAALVWRQRILVARTPTICGNSFWNEHWRRRGQRRSVDTGGIRSTLRRCSLVSDALLTGLLRRVADQADEGVRIRGCPLWPGRMTSATFTNIATCSRFGCAHFAALGRTWSADSGFPKGGRPRFATRLSSTRRREHRASGP